MELNPKSKGILSFKFLIFSLIVVLGIALRFYHLQFYLAPGSTDSVGYSYSASLYSRGEWLSMNATPKGFLLVSFMSLFYQILGPILLSGQLVSLLFGCLLPIITFFLGKELFDSKVGLLGAFIVSINPLLILYSCLTFREMMFSFTWMCSIYFALRGFKGNTFYAILGGIFLGLSSMTIEIGIFAGIGFILYYIVQNSLKNPRARARELIFEKGNENKCKNLDILFCSAILTMIPLFIRDYIVFGEPLASWVIFPQELFANIIRVYIYIIALSVPYVILFRVLFRQTKLPSVDRIAKIIKPSIIGFIILAMVLIIGYFLGLFSGNFEALAAQSFVGFVKFAEYFALPEYLGFLLSFFAILGIIWGLKARKLRNPILLCLLVFIFTHIVRAALLSNTFQYELGHSLNEFLTWSGPLQRVTWPFQIIFRYSFPFIPLFSLFASYGIVLVCDKILIKPRRESTNLAGLKKKVPLIKNHKKRINKNRIFKTLLVSIIIILILSQYLYAEMDLFSRADSHDSYQNPTPPGEVELVWWNREGGEGLSLIDWLNSQGSPVVYSFNSYFREKYGKDKVILLTGKENLLEIAKRARVNGVQFIISDALGAYSEAQYELYLAGLNQRQPRFRGLSIGYYELIRSYSYWHQAQVFKITSTKRMALVVQGTIDTGAPWVSILSNSSTSYIVQTVEDEEHLTEHFTDDYDVIVLTEIQRYLENDELALLREKVEEGTILIINGISPSYMNMEENSDWLGAKSFSEAPYGAKLNITFTETALDVLSEISIGESYALYSQSPFSSPTGLTDVNHDVIIYATRVEDGAITIFAKPYFNGVVIFSGVRHTHASETNDYGLYIKFIQNLLNENK